MLGDPYIIRRSLETAWHVDKPTQTPVNYDGGGPYAYDKNILSWYWNQNYPAKVYKSSDEQSLNTTLARAASLSDDLHFYQYTEMRAPSHDLPGENALIPMIIGGWERNLGSLKESRAVSITWPAGGGEDLARWVTYGDSKKIECRIFSFDPLPRQVTAQPYMIEAGTYEITLSEDNNGKPGSTLFAKQQKMKRFDTFTLEIPSGKPVLLNVQQLKSDKNQGPFPDLAVADYDCERSGSVLKVRVSNVGAAESKKTALTIYDSQGKKIAEKTVKAIDAPLDYVEKSVWVEFTGVPSSGKLRIIVDEKNSLEEIFKGNNTTVIQ